MGTSRFGVLLVDDFAPFRRVVSSMLKEKQDVQVIGEASDGLEAVQKAQELQPDLILMDIGLPKLNGIEAARRIRKRSPKSRILFVSQESSAVLVEEALQMGANGYVLKADAGSELLAAVNTVLRGEIFVGSRFAGHDFTGASVSRAQESALNSVPAESLFFDPQKSRCLQHDQTRTQSIRCIRRVVRHNGRGMAAEQHEPMA